MPQPQTDRPNGRAPVLDINTGSRPKMDPAVILLVEEIRRGQDALRTDFCDAQRETTTAIESLTGEMRELRRQAPGRLAFYLSSAVVLLALISVMALVASRGIDPRVVGDAASTVAPAAPVAP